MTFQLKESRFRIRERLKKKKKDTGFPITARAICHPDTAKPKPENNFAGFIYHLLDFERQILPFPPSSNTDRSLAASSLNHPTQINAPTTQSKYTGAN